MNHAGLRQRTTSSDGSIDGKPHIFAVQTVLSSHINKADSQINKADTDKPSTRRTSSINIASHEPLHLELRELPPHTLIHHPWAGKSANDRNKLLRYSELPPWQRDNNFIRTGYRPATQNYWKAFKSFGYLHNESGNMWTHAVGACVFVLISFWTYAYLFPRYQIQWATVTINEAWVLGCFFAGAITCLTMSTLFHCFCCHSWQVSVKWNKMDYVGIVALIVGSFIPAVYYLFYCDKTLQVSYIFILGSLGAVCIGIALADRFATPSFRWFRTAMFTFLGSSAIVPVLHAFGRYGFSYCFFTLNFGLILFEGGLYILGALLYGFRWPESHWPGKFDFFGTSHQIFHILVVVAACFHYLAIVLTFGNIHGVGGPASRGCVI